MKLCPTQAALHAILSYEAETGKLFWKPRNDEASASESARWNTRYAGKEAFASKDLNGYAFGHINRCFYFAHRIVWVLYYGSEPLGQIDHINGVPSDNRVLNLRDVSPSQNQRNLKMRSDNKSGACGVSQRKDTGKWQALIDVAGRRISLGSFETFEEAVAVRSDASAKYGFSSRHGTAPARPQELDL